MPHVLPHTHTHHNYMAWYLILIVAAAFVFVLTIALGPTISLRGPAIIPATGNQNAQEVFRQEELALYSHPVSSIGSDSFYAYRMDEWPVKPIDARYEFRRGEWFGN